MNFITDVIEGFPFSRRALVEISKDGTRHVHYFSELFARSLGLSGALLAAGVRRGDVVLMLVGNRVEWVISMLACFRMGAVALPCNTQLTARDIAYRVDKAKPVIAIIEEAFLDRLPPGLEALDMADLARIFDEDLPQATPAVAADLHPDEPSLIVFTSGTTGEPKGAVHSQRYLTGQIVQAQHWLGAQEGELAWCTAATGWSKSSRNAFIAPWLCGATAMLHDGRFDPEERLNLIEREGVNVLCQAPTEYRLIAKRTELRKLPSVRRMVSAGEALNPEVIDTFEVATGCRIADGYGQTETGAVTGVQPGDPGADRPGTMGKPLPGIQVRLSESDTGASFTGELEIKVDSSPSFFSHYLGEEPFQGEWWRTGDVVRRDEDGYLFHEGRVDDMISSSGYRIGPVEVESALIEHESVAEAAAVAAPDPDRGQVVKALVVLRRGYAPSAELKRELQDHCKRTTAPYKFPRIIEFVDELPKTTSGKIRRAELRNA